MLYLITNLFLYMPSFILSHSKRLVQDAIVSAVKRSLRFRLFEFQFLASVPPDYLMAMPKSQISLRVVLATKLAKNMQRLKQD